MANPLAEQIWALTRINPEGNLTTLGTLGTTASATYTQRQLREAVVRGTKLKRRAVAAVNTAWATKTTKDGIRWHKGFK